MSETLRKTRSDGSSPADAHPRVVIDTQRYPYRLACPNGHHDIAPTNSHVWCRTCAHQSEQGDDIEAEHYEVLDKLKNVLVPWSAIDLLE